MLLEERNVLVETAKHTLFFEKNYGDELMYITIYDKKLKENIVEDFTIINKGVQRKILLNINQKSGTIIYKGNMKFMIKNHDMIGYLNDNTPIEILSNKSIYDTRYDGNLTWKSKLDLFLREAWLKI